MQQAMQHAQPALERDYAPSNAYRLDILRRGYYRWLRGQSILAPLLGFTMYMVLVMMMSAETLFGPM